MVVAAASEGLSATSLFVLIVVLAGSVAAGLFFVTPLSARLRGASRRSLPSRPWSTSSVRDRLQDGR